MSGAKNLVGVTPRGNIVDVELYTRRIFTTQKYLIKTDQGVFTISGKIHSILIGTPVATHLDKDQQESILVIGTGKHARPYKLESPIQAP